MFDPDVKIRSLQFQLSCRFVVKYFSSSHCDSVSQPHINPQVAFLLHIKAQTGSVQYVQLYLCHVISEETWEFEFLFIVHSLCVRLSLCLVV